MEATLTTKSEPSVKSHVALPVRAEAMEGEKGAPVGMPLFLQRSVLSWAGGDAIHLKCDGCPKDEGEETPPVQFKLVIGGPNDVYEQEADRVAEAVGARPTNQTMPVAHAADERLQQCSACAGGEPCSECGSKSAEGSKISVPAALVQTKPLSQNPTSPALPNPLGSTIAGSPVSRAIRERVEPVLGVDLSHVQVHTDASGQASAKHLEAKAFTHQNHIWLGPHQSADDVSLMAHELTHVVQQSGAGDLIQRQPEDASEDGETVRRRLQQRIDEAVGGEVPATQQATAPTPAATGAETPAAATGEESPRARSAAQQVDRQEIASKSAELAPDAQPDVDRAEQQQPGVEQAARETVQELNKPGEPPAEGTAANGSAEGAAPAKGESGAAREGGGGAAGGAAERAGKAAVEQMADAAEDFSAANSEPAPDTPTVITPPPEVQPMDAG